MLPEIMVNTWPMRIWTVQEEILSGRNIVKWGQYEISHVEFLLLLEQSFRQLATNRQDLGDTEALISMHQYYFNRLRVYSIYLESLRTADAPADRFRSACAMILHAGRWLEATDPRDRLYGMFAILSNHKVALPPPDYVKPVEIIYEEVVRHIVQTEQSLWFPFSQSMSKKLKVPSWVPDWTARNSFDRIAVYWATGLVFGGFKATSNSKVDVDALQGSGLGELVLKGKIFSDLNWKADRFPPYQAFPNADYTHLKAAITTFLQWWQVVRVPKWACFLWNFIVDMLGAFDDHERKMRRAFFDFPGAEPLTGVHEEAYRQLMLTRDSENAWEDWVNIEAGSVLIRCFWGYLNGGVLFGEGAKNIGICYPNILSVEEYLHGAGGYQYCIALLAGCDVPVILHRKGDKYEFVCPAYVDGIMQGEAWPPSTTFDDLDTIILV
jgi:hypothetical protein